MSATIYQITNQINGKSYIGFDSHYPNRIKDHKIKLECPAIDNAIKKYGWNNFIHKILYIGEDEQHTLKIIEPFFIKHLNTKRPNGYNLTDGGDGCPGYKHTQETKNKLSLLRRGKSPWNKGKKCPHKGIKHTDKSKLKMSLSKLGKNNPNYNKIFSLKTRKKMSISGKKKIFTEQHKKNMSLARQKYLQSKVLSVY